ncbi:hypothetical protein OAS39_02200 [Pirellulales bacterium]|nr:hypothetical protein [Pirellulales bacterium]
MSASTANTIVPPSRALPQPALEITPNVLWNDFRKFLLSLRDEQKEVQRQLSELRLELRTIVSHGSIKQVEGNDWLVDRNQLAAILYKSPRTIANYAKHSEHPLPVPYCVAEAGMAHQYLWSEVRGWALDAFGRSLPETPPFAHF